MAGRDVTESEAVSHSRGKRVTGRHLTNGRPVTKRGTLIRAAGSDQQRACDCRQQPGAGLLVTVAICLVNCRTGDCSRTV
jgi:hypothetical protein